MSAERFKKLVEEAGGIWLGVQDGPKPVILFQDPETRSTCAIYPAALNDVDDVKYALIRKREQFAEAKA